MAHVARGENENYIVRPFALALLKIQILIFWLFWLRKIRKSEENQNKNQLTNTSINLGVMGISTLVLHSAYVYQ